MKVSSFKIDRIKKVFLLIFLFIFLFSSFPKNVAHAYTTNQSAFAAVGQANLTARIYNIDQSQPAAGLRSPYGVTTDGTRLIVGDYSNNRVLIWNSIPTTSGVLPNVVIGQTSTTSVSANQGGSAGANTLSGPTQVATDGTKLFVTDSTNNRILIFRELYT